MRRREADLRTLFPELKQRLRIHGRGETIQSPGTSGNYISTRGPHSRSGTPGIDDAFNRTARPT